LQSVLRFRPSARVTANFNYEYDVKRQRTRSLSLSTNLNFSRAGANVSWSRSLQLFNDRTKDRTIFSSLQGTGRIEPVPGKLRFEATGAYDYVNKRFINKVFSVRYDMQCCGFFVERRIVHYGAIDQSQTRIQIQLANIGSVGNFGQDDAYGPRGQAYGGRR
jgi:hypothetical protein